MSGETTAEAFDYSALTAEIDALDAGATPPANEEAPQPEGGQPESNKSGDAPQDPPSDEAVAREKGWKPKEEWKGDPKEWVDAKEFIGRQPLYEQLSKQGKRLKAQEKTMSAIVKHTKDWEQRIRAKAISEYEAQRREAVKFGDLEAFEKAEAALKKVADEPVLEVEPEPEEEKPAPEEKQPEIPDYVQKFGQENPWFFTDPDLQAVMVRREEMLIASGKSPEQALKEALAHVKTVFPSKFEAAAPAPNPNKDKPAAVMPGNREQRPAAKTLSSLTPEQRDVWRYYKAHGVMTEAQFLKSLED